MSSNTTAGRNWIERLSSKIPGYSGYVDRERRRDIDKLHREHLANRLRGLKGPLTDLMKDLTNNGRLFEVGAVDSTIKKLDHLENRIRFASYGYAGFFDVVWLLVSGAAFGPDQPQPDDDGDAVGNSFGDRARPWGAGVCFAGCLSASRDAAFLWAF